MTKRLLIIAVLFAFLPLSFFIGRSRERVKGIETEKKVQGVILPHHNLAREILIDSYEKLRGNHYNLIVILGPNHFYPEVKELIIPEGNSDLGVSEGLAQKIFSDVNRVLANNDIIAKEHSINIQKQYLEKYFPGTEIFPVVISPKSQKEDIEILAGILSQLPKDTLFIASVDFAHDLTYSEALENDKICINAIRYFDYEKVFSFDNRHLDSPKSIALLMKIMQKKNADNFQVIHNIHGAQLVGDPALNGTSYVVGFFE